MTLTPSSKAAVAREHAVRLAAGGEGRLAGGGRELDAVRKLHRQSVAAHDLRPVYSAPGQQRGAEDLSRRMLALAISAFTLQCGYT